MCCSCKISFLDASYVLNSLVWAASGPWPPQVSAKIVAIQRYWHIVWLAQLPWPCLKEGRQRPTVFYGCSYRLSFYAWFADRFWVVFLLPWPCTPHYWRVKQGHGSGAYWKLVAWNFPIIFCWDCFMLTTFLLHCYSRQVWLQPVLFLWLLWAPFISFLKELA